MAFDESLTAFVSQTEARLIVLENAVKQAWVTTLCNMDDPRGNALKLEMLMLGMVDQLDASDGHILNHDLAEATEALWSGIRASVERSTE